ncbi:MAG: hypothetical protein IK065_03670 [Neisseriaceae bacterium]|nr:hypothetical protein [Neisseriaceae bacterium]
MKSNANVRNVQRDANFAKVSILPERVFLTHQTSQGLILGILMILRLVDKSYAYVVYFSKISF